MDVRDRLAAAIGNQYHVDRELPRGGMARVFVARDVALNRDVVVKLLPPELAAGISADRFKREIMVSASLQHPHIVPVIGSGTCDDLPYYTMPFVRGQSLRDRLARTPLDFREALAITRDIARALAFAHRNGVVHRDIKPENVLLSDGIAVVTDFGIAKAMRESSAATGAEGLTSAGVSIGTPAYMAPEQAAGDAAVDHRADIYALGIVAYEMFAGKAPFAGRSPRELFAAQMNEVPPHLETVAPHVVPAVARLVMRCLEKAPEARPQSADDILIELDAVGAAEPARLSTVVSLYAAAFAAVTLLAWALTIGIGLPDWVVPGAVLVMALGAPILALTAASRAPPLRQSRLARHLTWRRVALGGGVALGAFALAVTVFMAMRAAGVGAPGTLLAAGRITRHAPVLVTDLGASPDDSALVRVVSEALRAGLQRSDVVRVVTPERIAAVLRLMRRNPSDHVSLDVAREVARREAVPVIVDGDLVRTDGRLMLTARLVASDSGTVLASQTQVVDGPDEIISAADKLSKSLRSKIGESLRQVRASAPLASVTTSSLEALSLYTRAVRAHDIEGDPPKARELLRQAVAIDSTFAMAWRKLFIVSGGPGRLDIINSAFRHRDRATQSERLVIEGTYYAAGGAPWADVYKSVAAYEALYAREGVPSNNLAYGLLFIRRHARAESLYRITMSLQPDNLNPPQDILISLMNQGKENAADSAARVARERFPDNAGTRVAAASVACGRLLMAECEAAMDSIRALPEGPSRRAATNRLANLALLRGQLSTRDRLLRELEPATPAPGPNIGRVQGQVSLDLNVRRDVGRALQRLDGLGDSIPRGALLDIAGSYARAGRPERARELITRWRRLVPDSIQARPGLQSQLRTAEAEVAMAESRWDDALSGFRAADRRPEGPASLCSACLPLDLAMVFDAAQMVDSSIVWYERFIATPAYGLPGYNLKETFLPRVHERLGQLHEARGNQSLAAEHYERFIYFWASADAELQPRVAAARQRLRVLKPLTLDQARRRG